MHKSRFESFIEAAIRKTKSGVLTWERAYIQNTGTVMLQQYDTSRSFVCSYAGGHLLLAYEKDSGTPHCLISPARNLPFQRIVGPDEDDSSAIILRLYNLVYGSFPSVDSFMDAMINSTDDPEEPPF